MILKNLAHVVSAEDVFDFYSKMSIGTISECWEWMGVKNKQGYGYYSKNGFVIKSHRFSYFISNPDWDWRLGILHSCDNPACCNPIHLRPGTNSENVADKIARKRCTNASNKGSFGNRPKLVGTSTSRAKLSELQVLEIRRRYSEGGVTQSALGKEFGVYASCIMKIVNRQKWTHI